jgi:hypothetical protein
MLRVSGKSTGNSILSQCNIFVFSEFSSKLDNSILGASPSGEYIKQIHPVGRDIVRKVGDK